MDAKIRLGMPGRHALCITDTLLPATTSRSTVILRLNLRMTAQDGSQIQASQRSDGLLTAFESILVDQYDRLHISTLQMKRRT